MPLIVFQCFAELREFATRAAKEAENLSAESQKKLKGVWQGEREIRRVGSGGTQNADLVLHPRHGVVVRKHARAGIMNPESVSVHAARMKDAQDRIGPKGFARVYEIAPGGVSYHEYVKGSNDAAKVKKRSEWVAKEWQKVDESREWTPTKRDKERAKKADGNARADRSLRLAKASGHINMRELKATKDQEAMMDYLDKKGYFTRDLRPANKVGGKFVDYQVEHPDDKYTMKSTDSAYPAHKVFKDRPRPAKPPAPPTLAERLSRYKAQKRNVRIKVKGRALIAAGLATAAGAGAVGYNRTRRKAA
ncbi:hypothetical protein EBZ80_12965 [bacterium]|nr:hypothetical protein [bacterium]